MYIESNYKKIGETEVTSFINILEKLPQEKWDEINDRQKNFDVHAKTKTIPLIFNVDYRHRLPSVYPVALEFEQTLSNVIQILDKYFVENPPKQKAEVNLKSKGYIIRAILVRLSANSSIAEHSDNGYSLSRCHRVHLPLITNKKVLFSINGVKKHLPSGELWEISNRSLHSVINDSNEDRVHLILDYVIPGEKINDPRDGVLIS